MQNKLQQYFPMIQTKEAILSKIQQDYYLSSVYDNWNSKQQRVFLDQCTGAIGVKMLYDGFFKEIMNPEYAPERLSEFLSLLLNRQVKVLHVLPNDSSRLGDESSLVLMDIVVQLDDGSLANLEVQKLSYRFPGQRSACYASDLLLRQYKKIRGAKGKKFVYNNVRPVYTIVLLEQSSRAFKAYPDTYRHYFEARSDTGLKLELLHKYIFIPLDIFRKILHNKGIRNRLEAWLAFLCEDDPEWIIRISDQYSEFAAMYEQIYDLCLNMEKVMELFSKELYQLDKNTVQFMIDEMQDTINQQKEALDTTLSERDKALSEKDKALSEKRQMALLTQQLIAVGRTEDLLRALRDAAYREQLLAEYNIE